MCGWCGPKTGLSNGMDTSKRWDQDKGRTVVSNMMAAIYTGCPNLWNNEPFLT